MITELLGLAGSGALGAGVGMVADMLQNRSELRLRELELEIARRAKEQGQAISFLSSGKGFSASPWFGLSFMFVCITYCTCCILCILWPDTPLQTFDPDAEPRTIRIIWGLIQIDRMSTKVYQITSGGVGYGLLHPLAFTLGAVLTGINPMRRS